MDLFDFVRIAAALGKSPQDLFAGFPAKASPRAQAREAAERLNEAIPDDVWELLSKLRKKATKKNEDQDE